MDGRAGFRFRWRSRLGVAVAFFLVWGLLNAFLAIRVPMLLHLYGAAAVNGLVMTDEMDGALLGRSLSDIARNDPRLNSYLVTFMDTMCAQMMSFALLLLGVSWFALRRGQRWALWVATLASIAPFLYDVLVISEFGRMGVAIDGSMYLLLIPALVVLAVATLGEVGLRVAWAPMAESPAKAGPPVDAV